MLGSAKARRSISAIVTAASAVTVLIAAPGAGATAPRSNPHSPSFAGYQVAVVPTKVSAVFTLPVVSCTSASTGVMDANLALLNFKTNNFSGAGVYFGCASGKPSYTTTAEINNHWSYLTQTLAAKNIISVSITTSTTGTSITIRDVTNKSTVSASVSGSGGSGAFTLVSFGLSRVGSGTTSPIPQFTPVGFSSASINGRPFAKAGGKPSPTDMYNGAQLQVVTGAINTKSQNAFTDTWKHS
jgi:hypothetical protein